jgi:hypothetical protein
LFIFFFIFSLGEYLFPFDEFFHLSEYLFRLEMKCKFVLTIITSSSGYNNNLFCL